MTASATPRRIVLLTDFGLEDTYVGVMKGVIGSIAEHALVQDLTHSVIQGDVRQAAYKLWQSVGYYPAGTIFVVVVDPGVGTARKAVGVEWGGFSFIAPDNGVLSYLLATEPFSGAVELTNEEFHRHPVSTTFHGRDVFAPAGAHLAAGRSLEEFGPALAELIMLDPPRLEWEDNQLGGEVIEVDHFGNAITSIGQLAPAGEALDLDPWLNQIQPAELQPEFIVETDSGLQLPLHSTFGDVGLGEPVAYLGSERLLEIAINGGSAAAQLKLSVGSRIRLHVRG